MPTRRKQQSQPVAEDMADAKPDNPTSTHTRVLPRRGGPLTDEERATAQETFLAAFARTANISQSAKRARVNRATVGVNEPLTNGQGLIYEMEVVLGKDGEPALDDRGRPKLRRGKIATVKKYSDGLLQAMLKARVPEYRDKKQVEVSGPNGGPIATHTTNEQVLTINLDGMSIAQLRALRAVLRTGESDGDSGSFSSSGG